MRADRLISILPVNRCHSRERRIVTPHFHTTSIQPIYFSSFIYLYLHVIRRKTVYIITRTTGLNSYAYAHSIVSTPVDYHFKVALAASLILPLNGYRQQKHFSIPKCMTSLHPLGLRPAQWKQSISAAKAHVRQLSDEL